MGRTRTPRTCGLAAAALVCLLACLLACPGLLAAAGTDSRSGGLQIGLEGAAFKDFLLFMGQFSGQTPVFREDQLPDATVSLVSRQPVSEADLAEMQGLVLAAAGLSATRRGAALYLLPDPQRPASAPGRTQILAQRLEPGLVPGQVARVLEGLRSDAGQVAAREQGRWVLIRDQAERVERARRVLAALEGAPAGSQLELAPLRRAEARLAARKLDMHFRGLPGKAPVVLALEWSNTVFLAGTPEQLDQARRLLAQMDAGGEAAPALRAFRLRYVKPEKAAGALAELAASGKGLGGLRVRVDAEAGAVVVLAEPEIMARVERLVAELDQPRPRVLVEALVLELPDGAADRVQLLTARPGAPDGALALANPPAGVPGGTRGFAQAFSAAGGGDVLLRGRAVDGPQGGEAGLDALAARLAAEPGLRVLARPRAAVQDGGEMRVSIAQAGPAGAAPGSTQDVERYRLVLLPLQDQEGGQLTLRVNLDDAQAPGRPQAAEARLPEGALLLLVAAEAGEPAPAGADKAETGWTLFAPSKAARAGRLGLVLMARVVRAAQSAPNAAPGLDGAKP